MDVYCGIDWAEDHHDIALADRDGQLLARRRISDDAAGLAAAAGPARRARRHRARTRSRWRSRRPAGCWSRACAPPAARSTPSTRWRWPATGTGTRSPGSKSDHGDSFVLANVLRTDLHAHRPLPADSELAQAIAVLARAQQDAVWDRTTAHNRLRSHLREYYPAFLAAFAPLKGGIIRPEARAVLAAAPTPADAAKLTLTQLRGLLKKAGRSRGIDTEATRLREALPHRADAPAPPRRAGHGPPDPGPARPARRRLRRRADLEHAVTESFNQHPDAGIITSFPGLGALTGARVLAEIGDDRSRFQDAKGLKAYAGAAPITRASGKTRSVTRRAHQEQPAQRRRLHLGVLRADRLTRRPRPLRPPQRHRRPARRRPAQPVQPPARLPAPLPDHRLRLRRGHRLPRHRKENLPGSLTT